PIIEQLKVTDDSAASQVQGYHVLRATSASIGGPVGPVDCSPGLADSAGATVHRPYRASCYLTPLLGLMTAHSFESKQRPRIACRVLCQRLDGQTKQSGETRCGVRHKGRLV